MAVELGDKAVEVRLPDMVTLDEAEGLIDVMLPLILTDGTDVEPAETEGGTGSTLTGAEGSVGGTGTAEGGTTTADETTLDGGIALGSAGATGDGAAEGTAATDD